MNPLLFYWINFLLLCGILGFVLKTKLTVYFTQQRKKLEKEIEETKQEYKKLKTEHEKMINILGQINQVINQMRNDLKRETRSEIIKLETENEARIEKLKKENGVGLENEMKKVQKWAEKEIFKLALKDAARLLQEDIKVKNSRWLAEIVLADEELQGKTNCAS